MRLILQIKTPIMNLVLIGAKVAWMWTRRCLLEDDDWQFSIWLWDWSQYLPPSAHHHIKVPFNLAPFLLLVYWGRWFIEQLISITHLKQGSIFSCSDEDIAELIFGDHRQGWPHQILLPDLTGRFAKTSATFTLLMKFDWCCKFNVWTSQRIQGMSAFWHFLNFNLVVLPAASFLTLEPYLHFRFK